MTTTTSYPTPEKIYASSRAASLFKTPRASGGKRSLGDNKNSSTGLEQSLKRVRLTVSSPGELCLQRDLKHLTAKGWRITEHLEYSMYTLEQTSLFVFHNSCRMRLQAGTTAIDMSISKHYPHTPPTITNISGCSIQAITFSTCAGQKPTRVGDAVTIPAWSPVKRLHDVLTELLHGIKEAELLNFAPNRFDHGYDKLVSMNIDEIDDDL